MAVSSRATPALNPALRHDIERWFARRGVPQLIDGYSTEPAMDARAAPLIAGWLVIGTIRDWGTNPGWSPAANVLGIALTLGWMALVWTLVSRVRGRPVRRTPTTFDTLDIVTLALLPTVPAALIDGSLTEGITSALGALTGIGVIYVIIGFGLIEIGAWALERLWSQVTNLIGLAARTLPLLLILVVFLLFGSEIWQVAHEMNVVELVVVLAFLLALAAVFVGVTFGRELARIEQQADQERILADASDTPVRTLIESRNGDALTVPRLTWLQRGNLTLLAVIPQLLQVIVVAVVVTTVLVVFATFAIPASVQELWIGEPPRSLATLPILGEPRIVSAEAVIVSAVLGGIVGLYFSGLAISDPSYRSEQFDRDVAGVRQLIAARAVYLEALRGEVTQTDPAPMST